MSERQRILEAFVAALETTARAVVLGAVVVLGEDDPEQVIAVVPDDDQIGQCSVGNKLFVSLPIAIHAVAKADLAEPWVAVEAMLATIKAHIETPDHKLGGRLKRPLQRAQTRTQAREPGSLTVSADVTYVVTYEETWGNP